MPAAGSTPEISLVVPFFNEEEAAYGVVDEIGGALEEFGGAWEAILVDDGIGRPGSSSGAAGPGPGAGSSGSRPIAGRGRPCTAA